MTPLKALTSAVSAKDSSVGKSSLVKVFWRLSRKSAVNFLT
jgi:hypothetical protein